MEPMSTINGANGGTEEQKGTDQEPKNSHILSTDSNDHLMLNTESMSFKLP